MRGRKPKEESRSAEIRQILIEWRQIPPAARLPLRAVARQLGTSHQLLKHYLDGLEKWQLKERYRKATEEADQILARAIFEDRPMTPWEEQRRHACTMAAIRVKAGSLLIDDLARLKQAARCGPLHPAQFKTVKMLARQGFPGAQELLEKCLQDGLKKKKPFAEIVRETPQQEGETYIAWVRRIWDECEKYDTKCPRVITEELLDRYSQGNAKNCDNNLPAISADAAKSFRTA